jgi:CheY-like chemotaxis protein
MIGQVRPDRRWTRQPPPAVLIVEDDAIVAEAAADVIEAAGYRTIRACNGWQALEALQREQPAMMLVDLSLPGMSGSQFLRFVRDNPIWSRIPRVIMTGTNDPMIRVREDAPVLYKPLDMDSLVAVVQRCCDRAWTRNSGEAERRGAR